ncbi:hypothetical protein NJB1604_00160 [Mycobacterium marinum]|uniref:hypothetical protein n=1 Tax=Mycobacterium marinum TaxID=1781 RepID=UPI0021C2D17A|nr:hypothetical protein [Mycobacterium marinum]GJO36595.1 hypothetical protein NJB1604_00160 [Mycobacterium marinum]
MTDRYQVVCKRHTPPVVLADITYDPNQEASQRYEREQQRWDRHNSGEETIIDELTGTPYPRNFRPYNRHSSRAITVNPRPPMFVPELVEEDYGPSDTTEYMFWRGRRIKEGMPVPRDGYVQVVRYEMGATENSDGREIRIACELCTRTSGKPLLAFASAETLALVLDSIGPTLDSAMLPLLDGKTNKPSGETVKVRVLPLVRLRKELGANPRG